MTSMQRRRWLIAGAVLLIGAVASAGDLHGFSFAIPEGFVSLKGAGPLPELAEGDAPVLEDCKRLEACAVKLRDGFVIATMGAKVIGGSASWSIARAT